MMGMVRLSGFILCALLLSSFPSQSDGQTQTCIWSLYINTLIYGGTGVSYITNLNDCQALCLNLGLTSCMGVDWDANNPTTKCYLQSQQTGKVSNQPGVAHYDLNCPANNCQWVMYANMNIYGGTIINATTLATCQTTCYYTLNCASIDWSLTNPVGTQCFLINQQNGKTSVSNVNHYDLVCNSTGSTVSGASSGTQNPLNSATTGATVSGSSGSFSPQPGACIWSLYTNTLIYGGTGFSNITNLNDCQSLCVNLPSCMGIDWDANNPNIKCYIQNQQTGKVSNQQGVNHYDLNCPTNNCQWVLYANMNIYGGTANNATSLAMCQTTCYYAPTCFSIDWSLTNAVGTQCFLINQQNGKTSVSSVNHYDLVCNSTGSSGTSSVTQNPLNSATTGATVSGSSGSFSPQPGNFTGGCQMSFTITLDITAIRGMYVASITHQDLCLAACAALLDCVGFDLSGPSYALCWLHLNADMFRVKYFQPNTIEFSVTRCPEQNVGTCVAAYDQNGVLTDYCATFCYPTWTRLENTAGSGLGAWGQVPATNFGSCLQNCDSAPYCFGVELRTQPGMPTACKYYNNTDLFALRNTTLTAFVTQYQLIRGCGTSCNVTWDRLGETRVQLIRPTRFSNITSEANCLQACRLSPTCEAAQWRSIIEPGCTLADNSILGSMIPESAAVTYVYREICPGPSSYLPPTPPPGNFSGGFPGGFGNGSGNGGAASTSTTQTAISACFLYTKNTNIPQGVSDPSTTLNQCQLDCSASVSFLCESIDWDNTRPPGSQCFLHTASTGKFPAPGVDHYDRVC